MVACFGSTQGGYPHERLPPERLAENCPRLDCFALYRQGILAGGGLRAGHSAQLLKLRPHGGHFAPLLVCPQCDCNCYKLYAVADRWACRKCHRLDYASRHTYRSVPGYHRIAWLRRRLGAEPQPFAPLPKLSVCATRKRKIADEIRALEARLVGHLRTDINDVLARRIKRRGMVPK
jgi:hypothetical protein